jgi:hypothetical protein
LISVFFQDENLEISLLLEADIGEIRANCRAFNRFLSLVRDQ